MTRVVLPDVMAPCSEGLVYFVEAESTNRIKIGWTRIGNLGNRVRDLQIACPFPLHVVATYEGPMLNEWREHQRFATEHIIGEWFHASTRLRDRIASIVRDPSTAHTHRYQAVRGTTRQT